MTFDDVVAYLERRAPVVVLRSEGGVVAVSPTYQGRVMTSAVRGDGASLGFVHRAFIDAGRTGTAFDNYGGEDRFWLGPEGGQFGLYFGKEKPFTFDAWQTPRDLQEGACPADVDGTQATFHRTMRVENHSGTTFDLELVRTVRILGRQRIEQLLGLELSRGVSFVGFESENVVRNVGTNPWRRETGLLSIWLLGMFAPAPDAKVVLPFRDAPGEEPIVNDAYFGPIPKTRLRVDRDRKVVVFTADGQSRGKIGLPPARATGFAGSYSASAHLLTLVQYAPPVSTAAKYVNSAWEIQADPYAGDVIHSYNDGPVAPGKPSLGGFYELETSSPGLALAPGASHSHVHRTLHFVGERAALDPMARAILGVPLSAL